VAKQSASADMKKAKVEKVMGEFKRGTLHSGSKRGPKVTSRKQAMAIALSEARAAGKPKVKRPKVKKK
jgi:microcystin degradation protein MlrC